MSKKVWNKGTLIYTGSSIVILFLLLLFGDFVWSIRERSVGMIARILLKQFGATDALNGLIISSIPSVIGMFLGPVIAYHSDRTRSRYGRRIPYLFITTPIVFVGLLGMGFIQELVSGVQFVFNGILHRETVVLWMFAGFWIFFEFGVIAGNAVFTALINDVVPQELLGRFYGLFRIIGLLAGSVFHYWFFGFIENHYMLLFLGIGVLYVISFSIICFRVKEGEYEPLPEVPDDTRHSAGSAVATYFRECFSSPYYLLLFAVLLMIGNSFMPINLYCVFLAKQLNISMDSYGKLIAWSYLISISLSFPLGILADRFHPLRCGIVSMGVYALSMGISGFLLDGESGFGVAVIAHTVISGSILTITASLPMRLLPQMKFAQYSSACGLFGVLINLLGIPAIGHVLDVCGNYRLLFFFDAGLAFLTVILMLIYYPFFLRHGGVKSYCAPEIV